MGRLAENIQHVTDAVTHRVYQVKTLFGNRCLVTDVVQRIDHKIDRHNIDAPTL